MVSLEARPKSGSLDDIWAKDGRSRCQCLEHNEANSANPFHQLQQCNALSTTRNLGRKYQL